MTNSEFNQAARLLQSSFNNMPYLANRQAADNFFNMLNRFDGRDVLTAVRKLVQTSQYAPSISEIIRETERAGADRRSDERQTNARETWQTAVSCPKCNDSGFQLIRREDGTETVRPCKCETGRAKFPWAFMDDDEWKQTVEEQRRKGKYLTMDRPGETSEFYDERCGEITEIAPGQRPPSSSQKWKSSQKPRETSKTGAYIDFTGLLEENPV